MMTTDGGAQAGERLVLDEAKYGAAVRAARQERGLSQRQLAQRCGINVTYLCDIEHGRRNPPAAAVRAAIQAETGVYYPTRAQLVTQVAALTAERDAADELRQQQHRAKSIVMDSQQREIVGLREQVETLTAERERVMAAFRDFTGDVAHFAQTVHQAHHADHDGTWLSCPRGVCPGLWRAFQRADAATTPPAGAQVDAPVHPTVVCLCGSTRFWRTFQQASLQETLAGRIVLSIGAASGTDDEHFGNLPR
ncbi:MAG: helix-turn-helix domain-containing protein, partial [Thermomicrobiales bacterium]